VAEFVGTFALIFVGVGAIAVAGAAAGEAGLLGVALAHGLTLAVMISATAAISGGHLNPAVTFGARLAGKISTRGALAYWAAQLAGGLAGAALIELVIPVSELRATGWGVPAPGSGIPLGSALLAEAILTFFLVFVVFGTAIDRRAPKVGGLFIGLTVALDILVGGPISGAAMNPARFLGPALVFGSQLQFTWLYLVGPLAGGAIAGLVWRYLLLEPETATSA
jgi:aquaporin Z